MANSRPLPTIAMEPRYLDGVSPSINIPALRFRTSGVIVMFLILWLRISIYTRFHPIAHQSQKRSPFAPVCIRICNPSRSFGLVLPPQKPESLIGRDYPSILSLLKDGKPAQIRICK
jgi:hypothetical protein